MKFKSPIWSFKLSRIQRITNPGSAVIGFSFIMFAVVFLLLGSKVINDVLGVVLFSGMTIIMGAGLILANIRHWSSSAYYPPDGYHEGEEIIVSFDGDDLCYGVKGKGVCKLNRSRIWRVRSGYFGCSILITVEPYYFVILKSITKDIRFTTWLNNKI